MSSMSSPEAQVFRTVELAELILSHLSLRDLLAAQRVNFLFYEVIRRNRRTRQSKYLSPDYSGQLSTISYPDTNPLFLQRFVQQACLSALQQLNKDVHFLGMDRFVRLRQKSFAEPDANWRQMLLFQPPVKSALLKSMSSHYEDEYHYIRNEEGLKLSDVVEFFQKKAFHGIKAVELLSATATRKVVWRAMPSNDADEGADTF